MNASAPTFDLTEIAQFLQFWATVTGCDHVTLVGIIPDGTTETRTFKRGEGGQMASWVAHAQQAGRNLYFQPNETLPECASKPAKRDMMAALCRFADIDPVDDVPLNEERDRLQRLGEHLVADPVLPPTAIIDSGNGIQPIWATAREVLSSKIIDRIEAETRAIEATLGAGTTHNIDRLLRLPGTVNFPNKVKLAKGRGTCRARLIHAADSVYTAEQIAGLAAHLTATLRDTGLIRPKVKASTAAPDKDADVAALITELEKAEADKISKPEDLAEDLKRRLEAAIKARSRLADRWAGMIDDLTEAGRDSSRSSADFSLAAMLKAAGFSHLDTATILLAYPHGKAVGDEWKAGGRLRYVARCALRSHEPRPAAATTQDADAVEWGAPLDFIADQDTPPPELREEHIPEPLWLFVVDAAERMGVDKTSVALTSLVSCASVITDDWFIQPKRYDTSWLENGRVWGLILGDPGILKSPVLTLCTKPVERLDAEARLRHQADMRDYKKDLAIWKKAGDVEAPEPTRPKLDRFLIEGATMEAISEALRDDDDATQRAPCKKVLSRQDEMSEFFANLDRYKPGGKGGGDRGGWLRLYNGGRHNIDRIGRGAFSVQNWSACFMGGCQPEPIQQIAQEAVEDGMLQRFVIIVPGPQQSGQDRAPNHAAISRYNALFPALVALQPRRDDNDHPCHVVLHEQAHRHREYINSLASAIAAMPDTSKRLVASYAKWPGLYARLCLTFHMIDIADCRARNAAFPVVTIIPEETAALVARFMRDIVLPHLLRADALMYRTTQTGHARWIAGYILARGLKEVTSRDITRHYSALRAPECRKELSEVIASLVLVGWLEPVDPGNALKPVCSWLVNPAVHMFTEKAAAERAARQNTKEAIAAIVESLRKKSGI